MASKRPLKSFNTVDRIPGVSMCPQTPVLVCNDYISVRTTYSQNFSGLGHVRLSIIDLPTGQQPLSDEEDSIYCVVTGEIYDHDRIRREMQNQGYSFKSKSDSELVVQL